VNVVEAFDFGVVMKYFGRNLCIAINFLWNALVIAVTDLG
jgi:hypothetical protein